MVRSNSFQFVVRLDRLTKSPGPSSNITLIRQISGALLRKKTVREWHQIPLLSDRGSRSKSDALRDSEPARNLEEIQDQAIDPYELPPIAEAHAYISHFFTQVALFLSCLHQKSFLETFRCHRANLQQGRPSSVSKVWLGILNLVFAISRTTMEGNTPDINKLAACEVFYQRAMKLGWERALRGRSVEIGKSFGLAIACLTVTETQNSSVFAFKNYFPTRHREVIGCLDHAQLCR